LFFSKAVSQDWMMYSQSGGRLSSQIIQCSLLTIAPSSDVGFCWYWASHLETGSSDFRASRASLDQNNRADYSACTTWGVFQHPNKTGDLKPNIILLDAMKERMEFPELKRRALDLYKEFEPDTLIIEKRAAGAPLIYEMRKMGIPIAEYTPGKGNDKISRVNAISALFESGMVWCPDTRWAEEVMDELASFPNGDHDDLVDSSSQALMRFRLGGFISIDSDEEDEPINYRRKVAYY